MGEYIVKSGDGWYKIAKNTGINVNDLLKLNNANLNTAIHPGLTLKILKATTKPTSNSTQSTSKKKLISKSFDRKANARTLQTALKKNPFKRVYYSGDIDGDWGPGSKAAMILSFKDAGYDQASINAMMNYVNNNIYSEKFDIKKMYELGNKKNTLQPRSQQEAAQRVATSMAVAGAKATGAKTTGSKKQKSEDSSKNDDTPGILDNLMTFGKNFSKNPVLAITDATLYTLDRMGAPGNATNYLRDLNVSLPYRGQAVRDAVINTVLNPSGYSNITESFLNNYLDALANPSWLTRGTTITPLMNTEDNFSDEELAIIKEMAGNDYVIDNGDIKRVAGSYGSKGGLTSYFTPSKVVQTTLGQTSGNKNTLTVTDLFDVNTVSNEALHDNAMYLKMAKENPGFNYETMRATMPYLNMIDIMPSEFKVQSRVKLK